MEDASMIIGTPLPGQYLSAHQVARAVDSPRETVRIFKI